MMDMNRNIESFIDIVTAIILSAVFIGLASIGILTCRNALSTKNDLQNEIEENQLLREAFTYLGKETCNVDDILSFKTVYGGRFEVEVKLKNGKTIKNDEVTADELYIVNNMTSKSNFGVTMTGVNNMTLELGDIGAMTSVKFTEK